MTGIAGSCAQDAAADHAPPSPRWSAKVAGPEVRGIHAVPTDSGAESGPYSGLTSSSTTFETTTTG
jgi:hypothetical protein